MKARQGITKTLIHSCFKGGFYWKGWVVGKLVEEKEKAKERKLASQIKNGKVPVPLNLKEPVSEGESYKLAA